MLKSNKMNGKHFIISVTFGLVAFTPSFCQDDFQQKLMKQFHQVSSEEVFSYASKLASPEFNGRMSGSPQFIKAAQWVAGMLQSWGIKPAGDEGTFFQWFDQGYNEVHNLGGLSLFIMQKDGGVITKKYNFLEGYFPGMNSGNGEVTAEVVFTGYGVTAPELNYDDYKNVDVKGKIVMFARDVPYKDARNPEYAKWVKYCYHQYKIENAARHGAIGMLYMDGIQANPNITYIPGFIWCGVSDEVVNDLFAGQKISCKDRLAEIDKSFKPASFNIGRKVTITASTTWHEGKSCNVLGMIEGTDSVLKKELIVVGAHLDAVGNCGVLLPGALDNASGCADIMGAVKAMASSSIAFKRSLMFAFFGSEETGLIGSRLLAEKLTKEKRNIKCMINLDMVGNGMGLFLGGGKSYPEILKYFEDANSQLLHRDFGSSENSTNYGRPRSDAANFERLGFPTMSIWVSQGVKKVYYHAPGDTPDALTPEIMEDVAKLLYVALTRWATE
jgi:hypothetical protein